MSCPPNNCSTIQLIEPDHTLLTGSSSGSSDPSLDESGVQPILTDQLEINIQFGTPKASASYRFEYLYVDVLSDPDEIPSSFTIVPTILAQTRYGFTVGLSGSPPRSGYILRWRVVVVSLQSLVGLDTPEVIYHLLSQGASLMTIPFSNPRSTDTYGFSELRVENLVDNPNDQTPIAVQIVAKANNFFSIAISPSPPTWNYFLAARVP